MTAVEMQHSFQNKLQGLNYDPLFFDTYRVQRLLNEAQNIFVDKYAPAYESDEATRKKLSILVKQASVVPTATGADNIGTNGFFITLPTDLRYVLMEYALTATTTLKVKPVKYDDYLIDKDNPFKKPDSALVWRLDMGTSLRHELITDGVVTLTYYKARYISNPTDIDLFAGIACTLLAKDHEEIVNIALSLIATSNDKQN